MEARIAGEAMERSIAGQVEFWARIGRGVEELLTGKQMKVLGHEASAGSIADRLDSVDTPAGRQRVKEYLASQPFPRYFEHPEGKGLLIREEEGGKRVSGRFVNREFVAVKSTKRKVAA